MAETDTATEYTEYGHPWILARAAQCGQSPVHCAVSNHYEIVRKYKKKYLMQKFRDI